MMPYGFKHWKFNTRSGGKNMKDSANYPITFGRHVATEHLKIMDSDARPIKLKPSCACTHVHVYIYMSPCKYVTLGLYGGWPSWFEKNRSIGLQRILDGSVLYESGFENIFDFATGIDTHSLLFLGVPRSHCLEHGPTLLWGRCSTLCVRPFQKATCIQTHWSLFSLPPVKIFLNGPKNNGTTKWLWPSYSNMVIETTCLL